ncbi:MAG: replication protein DnaD [Paenibacillaceae bacterium]|nr:replication protein DnaD [Paenibacillaceae bacterium]
MSKVMDQWKELREGMLVGLRSGSIAVPMLLLSGYAKLDLSEAEAMLILQLIGFREREHNDFPTPDELADRMSLTEEKVSSTLQKLMKEGFVGIDESTDSMTGMRYERYNLDGLWNQLAMVIAMETRQEPEKAEPAIKSPAPEAIAVAKKTDRAKQEGNIFLLFEREFARPLTPMEMETISGWLDQDRYPVELVNMALKEAVFAGKIHFRYIDRILLEWKRNKVFTPEAAKEYAQRFRGGR